MLTTDCVFYICNKCYVSLHRTARHDSGFPQSSDMPTTSAFATYAGPSSEWDSSDSGTSSGHTPRDDFTTIIAVHSKERECFLCASTTSRSRIPEELVVNTWLEFQIFVPFRNRCCPFHIASNVNRFNESSLFALRVQAQERPVDAVDVMKLMTLVTRAHRQVTFETQRYLDFENDASATNHQYVTFLGLD